MKREAMPLKSIVIEAPFIQWGLDVIGIINPKYIQGHSYILTSTYYFTKWTKYKFLHIANTKELILFFEENIFFRFGIPKKFIIDIGSIFVGSKFTSFCGEYGVTMG